MKPNTAIGSFVHVRVFLKYQTTMVVDGPALDGSVLNFLQRLILIGSIIHVYVKTYDR
jgi:hypothetical protein